MSISSIATAQQIQALQLQRPKPPDTSIDAGSPRAVNTAQGTGGTNPFSKLVDDLQAALLALQGSGTASAAATAQPGTATTGTTASTDASAATTDPLKTLEGDLQSLISQFQSGGSQSTQAAGGTQGHHHHHHHHDDGDGGAQATGATQPAATPQQTAGNTAASPVSSVVDSMLQAFRSAMSGAGLAAPAGKAVSLSA
eukprot:gene8908-8997_t